MTGIDAVDLKSRPVFGRSLIEFGLSGGQYHHIVFLILIGLNDPHVAVAVNARDGMHRVALLDRAVRVVILEDNLIVHHLEQAVSPSAQEIGVGGVGQEFNPIASVLGGIVGGHIIPLDAVKGIDGGGGCSREEAIGTGRGHIQQVVRLVVSHPERGRERQGIGQIETAFPDNVKALNTGSPHIALSCRVSAAYLVLHVKRFSISAIEAGLITQTQAWDVEQITVNS